MPAIGDNSRGVSEEDKDVLLAIHTRKIITARRQKKAAEAAEKAVLADAKNDGFVVKEIKDYVDVITSDDQKKRVDNFNMMRRNLEKVGAIPPQSKDLFADRVTREQQIESDGFQCGLNALEKVSRHTAGTDEDRLWLDAYERGKAKYDDRWEIVLAAMEAAKSKEEPPADGDDPFQHSEAAE